MVERAYKSPPPRANTPSVLSRMEEALAEGVPSWVATEWDEYTLRKQETEDREEACG